MLPFKLYYCLLICFFKYEEVSSASKWKGHAEPRETSNQFIENINHILVPSEEQLSHKHLNAQTELEENLKLIFKIFSCKLSELLIGFSNHNDFSITHSLLNSDSKLLESATDSLITDLSSKLSQIVSLARERSSIEGRQAETWLGAFGPIILKDIGAGFLKLCLLNLLWYFSPSTFSFITSFSLSSLLGISG